MFWHNWLGGPSTKNSRKAWLWGECRNSFNYLGVWQKAVWQTAKPGFWVPFCHSLGESPPFPLLVFFHSKMARHKMRLGPGLGSRWGWDVMFLPQRQTYMLERRFLFQWWQRLGEIQIHAVLHLPGTVVKTKQITCKCLNSPFLRELVLCSQWYSTQHVTNKFPPSSSFWGFHRCNYSYFHLSWRGHLTLQRPCEMGDVTWNVIITIKQLCCR